MEKNTASFRGCSLGVIYTEFLATHSGSRYFLLLPFADGEVEAHKGARVCLKSQSWCMADSGFKHSSQELECMHLTSRLRFLMRFF